ncbi:hypothetical protein Dda_8978 [Drechslerella dactyloides]|uniref:Uncharacterized protein n=1 Tax=Drechslerella dactyloides TaxID=74499 RepID=A0AAD6IPP9_DREDA|nr:hypothetical protein Dda_8978 [Drechslerella dactyloides]
MPPPSGAGPSNGWRTPAKMPKWATQLKADNAGTVGAGSCWSVPIKAMRFPQLGEEYKGIFYMRLVFLRISEGRYLISIQSTNCVQSTNWTEGHPEMCINMPQAAIKSYKVNRHSISFEYNPEACEKFIPTELERRRSGDGEPAKLCQIYDSMVAQRSMELFFDLTSTAEGPPPSLESIGDLFEMVQGKILEPPGTETWPGPDLNFLEMMFRSESLYLDVMRDAIIGEELAHEVAIIDFSAYTVGLSLNRDGTVRVWPQAYCSAFKERLGKEAPYASFTITKEARTDEEFTLKGYESCPMNRSQPLDLIVGSLSQSEKDIITGSRPGEFKSTSRRSNPAIDPRDLIYGNYDADLGWQAPPAVRLHFWGPSVKLDKAQQRAIDYCLGIDNRFHSSVALLQGESGTGKTCTMATMITAAYTAYAKRFKQHTGEIILVVTPTDESLVKIFDETRRRLLDHEDGKKAKLVLLPSPQLDDVLNHEDLFGIKDFTPDDIIKDSVDKVEDFSWDTPASPKRSPTQNIAFATTTTIFNYRRLSRHWKPRLLFFDQAEAAREIETLGVFGMFHKTITRWVMSGRPKAEMPLSERENLFMGMSLFERLVQKGWRAFELRIKYMDMTREEAEMQQLRNLLTNSRKRRKMAEDS